MNTSHKLFQQSAPQGEYRFWQQAWVVPDLLAGCQRWVDLFGIGPFHVLPAQTMKATHRGQETEFKMRLAVAQAGPVQIELIEPLDDNPSIYRDVYSRGQSGAHHMCTLSYDYDKALEHYQASGLELAMELSSPSGRVAYLDARDDIGLIVEMVEANDAFLKSLTAISETCARWDGKTDPIRLLKRGGYMTPDGREVLA